jgi:hypothetical protein
MSLSFVNFCFNYKQVADLVSEYSALTLKLLTNTFRHVSGHEPE